MSRQSILLSVPKRLKNEPSFVLLSMGANLGDRKSTIRSAIQEIANNCDIDIIRISSLYETEPVGISSQPWFLNLSLLISTTLFPSNLLQLIKSIETKLGRRARSRWTEREIDIDILLFDEMIIQEDALNIPHPQMLFRKFVLVPSSEIASSMIHPKANKTINELLILCDDTSKVELYGAIDEN